jgi:oxaloacetate decarboxylase beta subunit
VGELFAATGLAHLTIREAAMIAVAFVPLYLAIKKGFEPLLLVPIGFGCLMANLPLNGLMAAPHGEKMGGLFHYLSYGVTLEIFPPLIFLGLGALTDFGPLLANPKTLILGAAAQLGVVASFFFAYLLGFTLPEAASIGIIGGADGPTSIYLTMKLAPHLLGPIAVSAYSYIALVPLIQPPIMRLLTTEKERKIRMTGDFDVPRWLRIGTIKILVLGCIAFAFSTAGGVLLAKLMSKLPGSPVNPLIGAAGVSAVPMAARVVHNVGQEADPDNYLLMYAMGPNVAGVIGTAIAAGGLLTLLK